MSQRHSGVAKSKYECRELRKKTILKDVALSFIFTPAVKTVNLKNMNIIINTLITKDQSEVNVTVTNLLLN